MKGIIFDLDGTMVNNMMVHHRAWQAKLKKMGLELSLQEVMERVHGINEEILERLFGDRYTPEERRRHSLEKEEEYRRIFKPELKLIDGLSELLVVLVARKIPLAIGSAAPPENVDFVLDNLGIRQFFRVILHARSVTRGKPDPEIYQKAAAGLGFSPEECLIFEDTPVGAEAARRAGSQVIIVTTTHEASEFAEFPNVIQLIPDYRGLDLFRIPGA